MFILIKKIILLEHRGDLPHALEMAAALANCVGLFHLNDAMNDVMNSSINHCKRFLA